MEHVLNTDNGIDFEELEHLTEVIRNTGLSSKTLSSILDSLQYTTGSLCEMLYSTDSEEIETTFELDEFLAEFKVIKQ